MHISSLTHWGRVTHIYVSKLTIIGSDNALSPGRRQAIIWTNAGILLIGPLGTNFSEIYLEILTFSLTKMRLKVSSAKWRPFCLGLNVLIIYFYLLQSVDKYVNETSFTMKYTLKIGGTSHDDVIKWEHFPRYWPFVRVIHRSPVNSPHKGQWRGALMFSLICARTPG